MADTTSNTPLPMTFDDLSALAKAVTVFYKLHTPFSSFIAYYDDIRGAASLHRRDNLEGIPIKKVTELAAMTKVLHKHLIGITAKTANLLDVEVLRETNPEIVTAIKDLQDGIHQFRENVRRFSHQSHIPDELRKGIEEKCAAAIGIIKTLKNLPAIPIVFEIEEEPLRASIPQPRISAELSKCPGVLMVALQFACRGGIIDSALSPPVVMDFFAETVGVADKTASRRELLRKLIASTLKASGQLSDKQIEEVVPEYLSTTQQEDIDQATQAITPRKRQMLAALCALDPDPEKQYNTLRKFIVHSLEGGPTHAASPMPTPVSTQEATIVLSALSLVAAQHPSIDVPMLSLRSNLTMLNNRYATEVTTESLKEFSVNPKVKAALHTMKPLLEPNTPAMKAYYEIEALVPTNARPGGESKPKPRRNR